MPTSSRIRECLGSTSPLRGNATLLPGAWGLAGWPSIHDNGQFGGYLTAAADPSNGRVRVDLYWPGIRSATITRVHADGTTQDVRGGDPGTVLTRWARYDYEAPLDQVVGYQATSTQRPGLTATSNSVTVTAGTRAWLTHPTKPSLNRLVTMTVVPGRQRAARRGVLRPLEGKYPIPVNGVRQAPAGRMVIQTNGVAEENAINELLDDGSPLMLRMPAVWGGYAWYVSVDTSGAERADPTIGDLIIDNLELPFEVVDKQAGAAEGGTGNSYADMSAAYQAYSQVSAAASTYLELSMMSF